MPKRSVQEFEQKHGGSKIAALQQRLAEERVKVEALADVQNKINVEVSEDNTFLFGITGDRHFGSLYHHAAALHGFYEHCKTRGVERIYDAGDILDGHKVYRGQEFELRDLGLDAQLDRVEADHPTQIETEFITGNHDGSFKAIAGASVGKSIEARCGKHKFLGEDQARVEFQCPNGTFTLMLMHPGGGSSYALSYKPQKIVEALEGGTKPDMLAIGHFHKAEMMPSYRNVCLVQTGTFQKQTPFMAKNGLQAHVGGWIFEVTVGKGHNVIKGEFVAFYE